VTSLPPFFDFSLNAYSKSKAIAELLSPPFLFLFSPFPFIVFIVFLAGFAKAFRSLFIFFKLDLSSSASSYSTRAFPPCSSSSSASANANDISISRLLTICNVVSCYFVSVTLFLICGLTFRLPIPVTSNLFLESFVLGFVL
jgi:hypothetical protein